jgi:hydroxymethylbilane synthase
MNSSIKIASRSSPLALAQVEEIIHDLKTLGRVFNYETLEFKTSGDKDKSTPLTSSRDDFFTDTIDQALLEGKADIAIHSAKDLPQNLHEDLRIFALTQGLDNKDAWVSRVHWQDLPPKSRVGTSSVLRQKQILQMRPDVTIVNIRGTINERLQLVKEGKVDGIVAAVCALKRLKLDERIKDIFPWEGSPLQGQLAVVGRRGEHELANLFSIIDVRRQKTLLHCGTHPQMYRHLGKILHWPMIDIKPMVLDKTQQKKLLESFESADIIVFTSPYAVEYFLNALLIIRHPELNEGSQFEKKIFAVIGRSTQEALQKYNIKAAIMPQEETAQGLLKAMAQPMDLKGKRILFPRSSLPNPFLKDALSAYGAIVEEIIIYGNAKPAKKDLPSAGIDGVIFTSPSTVRNFLTDYGTIPLSWQIMAKGPMTLKTLQEAGYHHAASLS